MQTTRSNRTRPLIAVLAAAFLLVGAAGCARELRAEQDGKKAGEALCDLRDANDEAERQSALEELEEQLSDLNTKFSVFTAEDRADITENLSDLVEHAAGDNEELAQQDIAVIRRSLDHIRDDVGDTGRAAIDGFFQGIDDCVHG